MFFLNSRAVIRATGSKVLNFLNGFTTVDLKKLNDGGVLFSVLLNSRGRFLCDFFVYLQKDELFLDINKNEVEFFIKTIKLYDLLGEFNFEVLPLLKVYAEDDFLQNWKKGVVEGRFFTEEIYQKDIKTETEYNTQRIQCCLPDGFLELIKEKSMILEYKYEDAGAIDFEKGCYLGQELITRTKRTGEVRKTLCCIKTSNVKPTEALSSFGEYSLILCYKDDIVGKNKINLKEGTFDIASR